MQVTINGETRTFDAPITVAQLLDQIGLDSRKVAVERNLEIVTKSTYGQTVVEDGVLLDVTGGVAADAGFRQRDTGSRDHGVLVRADRPRGA